MKNYIGVKIVQAEPLTLGDYNKRRGWTIPADEDTARPGYFIEYPDGYQSWSPAEIFEAAYRPITDAEFGLVICGDNAVPMAADREEPDAQSEAIADNARILGGDKSETPPDFKG